jgi:hypothetical protein
MGMGVYSKDVSTNIGSMCLKRGAWEQHDP